jgi:hypothetical protein
MCENFSKAIFKNNLVASCEELPNSATSTAYIV